MWLPAQRVAFTGDLAFAGGRPPWRRARSPVPCGRWSCCAREAAGPEVLIRPAPWTAYRLVGMMGWGGAPAHRALLPRRQLSARRCAP
ncbi:MULTISPECIES: hypothetical protein [unclassified Streptomyces]|uniref:hypothetical protein n=1 Tax=unclassified Streptomyces TaxID=2593676 RepID=UPI003B631B76